MRMRMRFFFTNCIFVPVKKKENFNVLSRRLSITVFEQIYVSLKERPRVYYLKYEVIHFNLKQT